MACRGNDSYWRSLSGPERGGAMAPPEAMNRMASAPTANLALYSKRHEHLLERQVDGVNFL